MQGIDIDHFDHILASETETSSLLNFLPEKKFTNQNLYDLRTVFNSATLKKKLSPFIAKAQAQGIRTGAIRSSYSSFKQTIDYCISEKIFFDELNFEKEFWNGDGTFSDWLNELDQTIAYMKSKNVRNKFSLTAYIGWFEDGKYDQQALEVVKRVDKLQVHDYRVKPDEPYTRSRLTSLSKGAHTVNKIQNIIPLFSAEPYFLYEYLKTHSINEVINSYMSAYNADTKIPYKQNLSLFGNAWWFDYTYLKQVSPAV